MEKNCELCSMRYKARRSSSKFCSLKCFHKYISEFRIKACADGRIKVWNAGLTKKTDERVKNSAIKLGETRRRLFKEGKIRNKRDTIRRKLPIQEIIRLYVLDNKSLDYIGKLFNSCRPTIRSLLTEKGIKIREGKYSNVGRKFTKEHKNKIGQANLGKKRSLEYRQKSSKIRKELYSTGKLIPSNKGKECPQLAGKNNPNWHGGISFEPYTKDFNIRFKNLIRKRDNQICMLCGIHREKLNRALSIHHINYDKKLSIPQNCISLCKRCHGIANLNREYWTKFFQDLLSQKYGYIYNNKDIVINISNN